MVDDEPQSIADGLFGPGCGQPSDVPVALSALADTVDSARFLIGAEIVLTVVAGSERGAGLLDLVTPSILLLSRSCLGPAAFTAPVR